MYITLTYPTSKSQSKQTLLCKYRHTTYLTIVELNNKKIKTHLVNILPGSAKLPTYCCSNKAQPKMWPTVVDKQNYLAWGHWTLTGDFTICKLSCQLSPLCLLGGAGYIWREHAVETTSFGTMPFRRVPMGNTQLRRLLIGRQRLTDERDVRPAEVLIQWQSLIVVESCECLLWFWNTLETCLCFSFVCLPACLLFFSPVF